MIQPPIVATRDFEDDERRNRRPDVLPEDLTPLISEFAIDRERENAPLVESFDTRIPGLGIVQARVLTPNETPFLYREFRERVHQDLKYPHPAEVKRTVDPENMRNIAFFNEAGNMVATMTCQYAINGGGTHAANVFEFTHKKADLASQLDKLGRYVELSNFTCAAVTATEGPSNPLLPIVINRASKYAVDFAEEGSQLEPCYAVVAMFTPQDIIEASSSGVQLTLLAAEAYPKSSRDVLEFGLANPQFISARGVASVFREISSRYAKIEDVDLPKPAAESGNGNGKNGSNGEGIGHAAPLDLAKMPGMRLDRIGFDGPINTRFTIPSEWTNSEFIERALKISADKTADDDSDSLRVVYAKPIALLRAVYPALTPEQRRRIFTPRMYYMPVQALQNITRAAIVRDEKEEDLDAPLEVTDYEVDIRAYAQRRIQYIPVSSNKEIRTLLARAKHEGATVSYSYTKEKGKPAPAVTAESYVFFRIPGLRDIHGNELYRPQYLALQLVNPERFPIIKEKGGEKYVSEATARRTYLAHALTRAGIYKFQDFFPKEHANLPPLERIMHYLSNRPYAKYGRIESAKPVGIVGQGTAGLAGVEGLALWGVKMRVSELPEETVEVHNIERIPIGIQKQGYPKLAVGQDLALSKNPFAQYEVHPRVINSVAEAREFVNGLSLVQLAVDDPRVMYYVSVAAREARIPVVLITDLHGVKVQVFDYRDERVKLFNGAVPKGVISALDSGIGDEETFGLVAKSLAGSRRVRDRLVIPQWDMLFHVPKRALEYFEARISGTWPHVAQDRDSAIMAGQQMEKVTIDFLAFDTLPRHDYFRKLEEDKLSMSRFGIIRSILSQMKAQKKAKKLAEEAAAAEKEPKSAPAPTKSNRLLNLLGRK